MRAAWRVSKYDPNRRTAGGAYTVEDWTAVTDIGRSFGGVLLTQGEYLRVEQAYVDVVSAIYADAGSPILQAHEVSIVDLMTTLPGQVCSSAPSESEAVRDVAAVVRSCLREMFWCKLESSDRTAMIHFGYDFYLYLVGMDVTEQRQEMAAARRIFIEPFQSPYASH